MLYCLYYGQNLNLAVIFCTFHEFSVILYLEIKIDSWWVWCLLNQWLYEMKNKLKFIGIRHCNYAFIFLIENFVSRLNIFFYFYFLLISIYLSIYIYMYICKFKTLHLHTAKKCYFYLWIWKVIITLKYYNFIKFCICLCKEYFRIVFLIRDFILNF